METEREKSGNRRRVILQGINLVMAETFPLNSPVSKQQTHQAGGRVAAGQPATPQLAAAVRARVAFI
jgi:hypothetical protein